MNRFFKQKTILSLLKLLLCYLISKHKLSLRQYGLYTNDTTFHSEHPLLTDTNYQDTTVYGIIASEFQNYDIIIFFEGHCIDYPKEATIFSFTKYKQHLGIKFMIVKYFYLELLKLIFNIYSCSLYYDDVMQKTNKTDKMGN